MSRVLLIGWDGADWRILDPMLEAGLLPNLGSLIDRGARGALRSTTPNHSWAAWPSFLTGVEPSNHGVYDIFEKELGVRKSLPVTYRSIKEKTMLADRDRGVLLVEQLARVALAVAHRGYLLERGRVALSGTSSELRANERVREIYMGVKA